MPFSWAVCLCFRCRRGRHVPSILYCLYCCECILHIHLFLSFVIPFLLPFHRQKLWLFIFALPAHAFSLCQLRSYAPSAIALFLFPCSQTFLSLCFVSLALSNFPSAVFCVPCLTPYGKLLLFLPDGSCLPSTPFLFFNLLRCSE